MTVFKDDYGAYIYVNSNNNRLMAYDPNTKRTVVSLPRLLMERYLGRELTTNEEVHHKDGNIWNNTIENLVILSKEEHRKIHNKRKKNHDPN